MKKYDFLTTTSVCAFCLLTASMLSLNTSEAVSTESYSVGYEINTLSTGGNSYKNEMGEIKGGGTASLYPVMRTEGGLVTITLKPNEGYEVEGVYAYNSKKMPVPVIENGQNSFQFYQPDSVVTVFVDFVNTVPEFSVDDLSDVVVEEWFYPFVDDMVKRGIMLGTDDGLFKPHSNATRAEMSVIISNISGANVEGSSYPFTDVSSNHWYHEPASWCVKNGILVGNIGDLFEGDRDITREELVTALYYYAKLIDFYTHVYTTVNLEQFHDYTDISVGSKYAMSWGVGMGFIEGDIDGYLNPLGSASRAEISVILSKFMVAHDFHDLYGKRPPLN